MRLNIICAIIFTLTIVLNTHIVEAQGTMMGGSYTLDGNITAFTSNTSGGGYIVGSLGDPIVGQNSSGGTFTLSPSPFDIQTSGSGSITSGMFGTNVSSGGFTYVIPIVNSTPTKHAVQIFKHGDIYPTLIAENTNIFDQDKLYIRNPMPEKKDISGEVNNDGVNTVDRKYELGESEVVTPYSMQYIAYTIIFLLLFSRLFKWKKMKVVLVNKSGMFVCSRYPISILLKSITLIAGNNIKYESCAARKYTGLLGVLIGNYVVFGIGVIGMISAYNIGSVYSLIIGLLLMYRLFIWHKL